MHFQCTQDRTYSLARVGSLECTFRRDILQFQSENILRVSLGMLSLVLPANLSLGAQSFLLPAQRWWRWRALILAAPRDKAKCSTLPMLGQKPYSLLIHGLRGRGTEEPALQNHCSCLPNTAQPPPPLFFLTQSRAHSLECALKGIQLSLNGKRDWTLLCFPLLRMWTIIGLH